MVVQYNKRDLPGATPIDDLRSELSIPEGIPEYEAQAVSGVGVFETLKGITRECLKLIPDPSNLPEGRTDSITPDKRPSMHPEANTTVTVPAAAKVPTLDGSSST
jgi:hypothetical protein